MCSFKIPCYAAGLLFTFRNNRSSICTAFDCGIAIGGITIPQNPSNTFSSACHSCSILAIKNTDLSICVSRNCTRTRSARDSTRSGNILYRCPPTSFLNKPVLALPLVISSVTVWPLPSKVPEKSLA